jgi:hypothetical protein
MNEPTASTDRPKPDLLCTIDGQQFFADSEAQVLAAVTAVRPLVRPAARDSQTKLITPSSLNDWVQAGRNTIPLELSQAAHDKKMDIRFGGFGIVSALTQSIRQNFTPSSDPEPEPRFADAIAQASGITKIHPDVSTFILRLCDEIDRVVSDEHQRVVTHLSDPDGDFTPIGHLRGHDHEPAVKAIQAAIGGSLPEGFPEEATFTTDPHVFLSLAATSEFLTTYLAPFIHKQITGIGSASYVVFCDIIREVAWLSHNNLIPLTTDQRNALNQKKYKRERVTSAQIATDFGGARDDLYMPREKLQRIARDSVKRQPDRPKPPVRS